MKRREFIILTGVGATGTTVLSACGHPEEKLIPALIPDNEYVPGIDYWKASTCNLCPASCGIVVRTREHEANKIEGNPFHPVNRGALCARGQAGLQVLYNPDRIKHPLRRAGERGEGKWQEITWEEAIKSLANKLREIKTARQEESVVFITGQPASVDALIARRVMEAYGSAALLSLPQSLDYDPNYNGRAVFDIGNATYLLSFGARFLETWESPVMYSLAYGEFRQTRGRARGKFVQVEPRMSLTGANADDWLPAAPGAEGVVALSIAQVIIREKLNKSTVPALPRSLDDYAPERLAAGTGIAAETLVRVAREFAAAERPLAICSRAVNAGSAGCDNSNSIDLLNALVGNLNAKGGILLRDSDSVNPVEQLLPQIKNTWQTVLPTDFAGSLRARPGAVLLLHHANPVYATPQVRDEIKNVSFLASFSSFLDETSELADLILPDNTYLESWNLSLVRPMTTGNAISLTQPVIPPLFETRQTADVLIQLSRELGGEIERAIPFASAEEVTKRAALATFPGKPSAQKSESGGDSWSQLAERGVLASEVEGKAEPAVRPWPRNASAKLITEPPESLGKPSATSSDGDASWPFVLLTYEHAWFGEGQSANLPALQELPDPLTSVMWGSWVEINPATAAKLGIADGDLVEISTSSGSMRVPAVLYPAIRPEVIAIPYGQGHASYGRYASGRGVNLAALNPGYQRTIAAGITRVEGKASLIRFGTEMTEEKERRR